MDGTKSLTRDHFREGVFTRDNNKCVFCPQPAIDAHHILERRLFSDGGYYLNNGASVCGQHHMECEMTTISVRDVRFACKIEKPVLPEHFYDDVEYDKWGNICLDNGTRLRGDLFNDESVQKVLKQGGVLDLFVPYVKYGRTYHLPWSPGMSSDDRMMPNVNVFDGKRVIVMEKLDGENTTLYNDYSHARSVTSGAHASRNWVRSFHSQFMGDIPDGWRINVENVFAKHSIKYNNLETYAYGFAIWNEQNRILPWGQTLEWFELFGITPCPVIYWGVYDEAAIKQAYATYKADREAEGGEVEGYVIRVDEDFHYSQFKHNVGKYVRKGHVNAGSHWMYGKAVVPNTLKEGLTGYEPVATRDNNEIIRIASDGSFCYGRDR